MTSSDSTSSGESVGKSLRLLEGPLPEVKLETICVGGFAVQTHEESGRRFLRINTNGKHVQPFMKNTLKGSIPGLLPEDNLLGRIKYAIMGTRGKRTRFVWSPVTETMIDLTIDGHTATFLNCFRPISIECTEDNIKWLLTTLRKERAEAIRKSGLTGEDIDDKSSEDI